MPRFQENPETEFEFYLATKLGMTVGRLREEMSADEYMRWGVYYGRQAQRKELELQKAKNTKGGR